MDLCFNRSGDDTGSQPSQCRIRCAEGASQVGPGHYTVRSLDVAITLHDGEGSYWLSHAEYRTATFTVVPPDVEFVNAEPHSIGTEN
jgi:hypothetical protein